MSREKAQELLLTMFRAAVSAADPRDVLKHYLPEVPTGRVIVVGAGKASAAMAQTVEDLWPDADVTGAVVVPYGHVVQTQRICIMEAAHPVPDRAGLEAAKTLLDIASSATAEDVVLALISGGGSSLLPCPKAPLTFEDEVHVNRLLLRSGLAIDDMNKVRRRISAIKGGGLARAATPAKVVTLAISDVPGDNPAAIASGPTVPDPSASEDLSSLAKALGQDLPTKVKDILSQTNVSDTIGSVDFRLIAAPQKSLETAALLAKKSGVLPILLGDALEGEARDLGAFMAGIARSVSTHGTPGHPPAVLISGGETTVTIGDETPGRGGRNTEFLLSLALELNGTEAVYAIAGDTDGIDGTEDAAGAIIGPNTLRDMRRAGIDPVAALADHNSYAAFAAIGALVKTGPTLTNVNDFRAILVECA
ncbi:glycerate kinase type-2 family protein [Maritimibacter dapengensis]|uniref:Glycerate kinase n=1 Tax=Maritimibacter dapengensis TaxID=2836868 RepID=A0ABS6T3Z9_9RHOB|nr:glycerate kinase [Maritimibacter dapengensis]MBV7379958.1 glycerate kinase [Maritimibacter dapengensis]